MCGDGRGGVVRDQLGVSLVGGHVHAQKIQTIRANKLQLGIVVIDVKHAGVWTEVNGMKNETKGKEKGVDRKRRCAWLL